MTSNYQKKEFIQWLTKEEKFDELYQFAKNCFEHENLLFFKSYLKAEQSFNRSDQLGKNAFARFLQESGSKDVAVTYIPHNDFCERIYKQFISSDAPYELNLKSSIKQKILQALQSSMLPSNIFDEAIDEVLVMIYLNTFKKFMHLQSHPSPCLTITSRSNSPVPSLSLMGDGLSKKKELVIPSRKDSMSIPQRKLSKTAKNEDLDAIFFLAL